MFQWAVPDDGHAHKTPFPRPSSEGLISTALSLLFSIASVFKYSSVQTKQDVVNKMIFVVLMYLRVSWSIPIGALLAYIRSWTTGTLPLPISCFSIVIECTSTSKQNDFIPL